MSQKSSVPQAVSFVSQVLKRDMRGEKRDPSGRLLESWETTEEECDDGTLTQDALNPWSPRFSLDAARAARDAAYEAYDLLSQNAWRNPG